MHRSRLTVALLVCILLTACGSDSPTPVEAHPQATEGPTRRALPLVIAGVAADHSVITQQFVEIVPSPEPNDSSLQVSFERDSAEPISLGIEGALFFIRAHAPNGTVVLDRLIDANVGDVSLPAGDYVLVAYYATCDGSCNLLDPPQTFCTVDASVKADGRYELRVTLKSAADFVCALTDAT